MDGLLPIGSVVLLKGGKKRVMIYGRKQIREGEDKVWDYIACLYPEGNLGPDYTYVFDHKSIKKVFFIGFQDYEEIEYKKIIKQSLEQDEIDNNSMAQMHEESIIPDFVEIENGIGTESSKPVAETNDDDLDSLISSFASDTYQNMSEKNQDNNTDTDLETDAGIDVFEDILSMDINPDSKE